MSNYNEFVIVMMNIFQTSLSSLVIKTRFLEEFKRERGKKKHVEIPPPAAPSTFEKLT